MEKQDNSGREWLLEHVEFMRKVGAHEQARFLEILAESARDVSNIEQVRVQHVNAEEWEDIPKGSLWVNIDGFTAMDENFDWNVLPALERFAEEKNMSIDDHSRDGASHTWLLVPIFSPEMN